MFCFIAAFILLHVWFHVHCAIKQNKCCNNLAGFGRTIAADTYLLYCIWNHTSRQFAFTITIHYMTRLDLIPWRRRFNRVIIASAFLSQYTRVSNRRTDRQTTYDQGRNQKLKSPIPWYRVLLPFYRKNRQVYPVWCSRLHNHKVFIEKLCKKLGSV